MFQFHQDKRYASDLETGVYVETMGRYKVLYFVKEHLLILRCDGETGKDQDGKWIERIFFPETLQWEWPYHQKAISKEDRETIRQNIIEAYAVLEPNSRVEFKELISEKHS